MSGHTIIYPVDTIPSDIVSIITTDYEASKTEDWDGYDSVWAEQLERIQDPRPDWYFVAAFDFEYKYIGGVFLFLDNLPDDIEVPVPVFQGISKSRYGSTSPLRLNSLLIPAIVKFVKMRGYHQLNVLPYGKQADILIRHFGFIGVPEYPLVKNI